MQHYWMGELTRSVSPRESSLAADVARLFAFPDGNTVARLGQARPTQILMLRCADLAYALCCLRRRALPQA
ncbi:hypothetical protein DK843_13580 [Chromobacterium phragmitis]|uniref:Uncharacterized protein n=1 Tax=Chromobacterium phragmitis TaxID=2202141 RepID=A0A344UIY3_9NEIS|nr:hypothetical protein DK843_13580 [Chromobacterium phragmitis]